MEANRAAEQVGVMVLNITDSREAIDEDATWGPLQPLPGLRPEAPESG